MKKQLPFINTLRLTVCLMMVLLGFTASGKAATVRGRVDHISANHQRTVMAGIAVTVFRAGSGRSAPIYTDRNGMYYLQNIPAGTYSLEIWVYGRSQPLVYRIHVNEPYTDIPPVTM